MPKLPVVTGRQLLKALTRAGFVRVRQRGSHVTLRHADGRFTSVPVHAGKDLPKGTLRAILDDLDMGVEALLALL